MCPLCVFCGVIFLKTGESHRAFRTHFILHRNDAVPDSNSIELCTENSIQNSIIPALRGMGTKMSPCNSHRYLALKTFSPAKAWYALVQVIIVLYNHDNNFTGWLCRFGYERVYFFLPHPCDTRRETQCFSERWTRNNFFTGELTSFNLRDRLFTGLQWKTQV